LTFDSLFEILLSFFLNFESDFGIGGSAVSTGVFVSVPLILLSPRVIPSFLLLEFLFDDERLSDLSLGVDSAVAGRSAVICSFASVSRAFFSSIVTALFLSGSFVVVAFGFSRLLEAFLA
jgi:hypothetical protein